MKQAFIAFTLCAVLAESAIAHSYSVDRNIGIGNGLSNNYIFDLTIDKRGFVWVATEAGVNLISGNTVTVFNNSRRNSANTVIGNEIRSLFYDLQTDQVFIGTESGLSIYHYESQTFRNFTPQDGLASPGINDIAGDSKGGAWLFMSNGRVQHINCSTYKLSELELDTLFSIRSGYDDGNGHLYLGHIRNGLSIVDLNNKRRKHLVNTEGDLTSLPGNNVRSICQDKMMNIWIGTDHGMALYNPATDRFVKVTHQNGFLDDNVFCIKELSDHRLWIASDMGGISLFDLEQVSVPNKKNEHLTYYEDAEVKLSSINTRCLAQDEFGNIWVGNYSTGIDFIAANKPIFNTLHYVTREGQAKRIYGICSDSDDNVWLGGEDELSLFNGGRLLQSWPIVKGKRRSHSFVMCIMADSQGNVWLGMEDDGVIKFNRKSQTFERIDIGNPVLDIRSFCEDSDGKIWIGNEYGVYSFLNGHVSNEPSLNKLLHNPVVTTVLQLPDGRMLFTTLGMGMFFYDPKKGDAQHYGIKDGMPSYNINHAIVDDNSSLWIGTYKGLVCIPDISKPDEMYVYDEQQGLADCHIRALQTDRHGRIWLSTYTGLACFDTQKKRFYNFNHSNNIPSGSFVGRSATTTSDGTMYFGSPSGVCYFNPQLLNNSQKVSTPQIVLCEAFTPTGEEMEINSLIPDKYNCINAEYKQNTLRIAYTVSDYSQTDNVEYSYLMKGLSDEWYYIDDNHSVTFRGLAPGKYTFCLRAKLRNQDWNTATTTEININIAPPLWLTWWAKVLYALAVAGLIVYYFRSYKRKLKLESSLQLAQRENLQKEELHEERLRFFTNVTHELRTPLTLIVGPLQDLVDDKRLPEACHNKVEMINKSAERLQNLINDILEFRKTETQNRKLCVAKGDLKALVKETGQYFKDLNRNPKLSVYILVNPAVPDVYFDSEVITTVISNLLSNAMKYTPQGKINLILNTNGDRTEITVADTGYGIAKDALPHIFDRYYQAKGKHQASGTGIGLALVKSLADLHEAELRVESKQGEGSKFTFSILTDNAYPNALHKVDEQDESQEQSAVKWESSTEDLPAAEANQDERPTLLVVEDNDQIRQYIADSLGEDYRIIQAENGLTGVSAAIEWIPDIIVSDIMMPEMDGIALTKTLKEDIRTSHIPIILLTAKDSLDDKEEGYDSGADSYLTKPFTAKLLNSRIQNLLNSRRRLAEQMILRNMSGSNQEITELADEHSLQDTEPVMSKLDQEFMSKLNGLILDNLLKVDIDMAFLTDKMAMSHSTFYRKVKALTGMTAVEYIRKMKLKRSMVLLQSGEYNVTEAAMMAGFNNQGHFRDSFKKEFGVNPSEVLKKQHE